VGLGSVPTWLRPYKALSEGEKYRANLAKLICEVPQQVVVDEFSSVVDRQIAKFGALAFAKSWKRVAAKNGAQCVLLSCHYDIIDWLQPDWVFDLNGNHFHGRWLRRRPKFTLEVRQTDWRYWPLFEPHHYLKLPLMVAAKCYIGLVDEEPVCHVAVSGAWTGLGYEARACRLVVMPEWQGAGIGIRFLNYIAQLQLDGKGRTPGKKLATLFHTSHPGLAAALRRDRHWRQITARLYGERRSKCMELKKKTAVRRGDAKPFTGRAGFGGHFRAIQGFRYYGADGLNSL
jgi:GNAT superfamily N-acetyltransferase